MSSIAAPFINTNVLPDTIYNSVTGVNSYSSQWEFIPIQGITDRKQRRLAMRLNSQASLFYFIKAVLGRKRLTEELHYDWCSIIEKEHIQDVIEIPRDHFKSTIFSEGAPMWWALPFDDKDEDAMRKMGYGDAWIRWMKIAHNRNTRTLLISEIIDNAMKLGRRINHHYQDNVMFRKIFSEVIPDSSCVWNAKSMMHKRTVASPDGEGTYDFLGVGGSAQSRHYDRAIEDDLVGRDAINSEAVMEDTINYHRLLPGVFDSSPTIGGQTNDELVVGNRWSYKDLNQWIRDNEPWFQFTTHSASGGCCKQHPADTVIFPQEWSKEKLAKWKVREGIYYYSCQYENKPIAEGTKEFNIADLNFYETGPLSATDTRMQFIHEVKNGNALPNIMPGELQIELLTDPRHSDNEKKGRSRHAIVIIGYMRIPQRFYLIESWAEFCGYEKYVAKIYELVKQYRLRRIWMETYCAQKILKFHLDYRNKVEGMRLRVEEFNKDFSADAKSNRIRAMNLIYADGQFFLRRGHTNFVEEYEPFPYGKTIDVLDVTGYAPQVFVGTHMSKKEINDFMAAQMGRFNNREVGVTGYC